MLSAARALAHSSQIIVMTMAAPPEVTGDATERHPQLVNKPLLKQPT